MSSFRVWKGKGEKSCVYCGSTVDITSEHVFPSNLFTKPKPKNLITVPACVKCNGSFALDDEYFRLFAILRAVGWTEQASKIWEEKIVNSTFKRSPGLLIPILKNLKEVDAYSEGGIYLGTQLQTRVDPERVRRVFEKIGRGLFRHHIGRRLGSDCPLAIGVHMPLSALRDGGLIDSLGPVHSIGDGSVIRYRFNFVVGLPDTWIWLINLYKVTLNVVVTNSSLPRKSVI